MLVQTVDRLSGLVDPENVLIITNREQRPAILEICPNVSPENIIAEPVGRDTAAAVGLATLLVEDRDPDAAFAMLPADHVIHDADSFKAVLDEAFRQAESASVLVTVGIEPKYAATGYGYIQRGSVVESALGDVFEVEGFREKPDAPTAELYVASGDYFWNAGMFIWQGATIRAAFEAHAPALWAGLSPIREGLKAGRSVEELLDKTYPGLEKISVDYAIMEKAGLVRVVRSTFDWDDVGEWPAIERHHEADASGNVIRGSACIEGGGGNIVFSEEGHTIALVGVDDLIVVHTGDATLVCPKDRAQDIKALVKRLGESEDLRNLL